MSSSSEEKKCQPIVERSMEKLCEIFGKMMERQQSKVNTETVNHTLEPNPVKLSGPGSYISWARHAKLILSSHGYVHLLMAGEDEEGDSRAKQINDRVLVWLFGSMESVIREQVETLATVTEVWLELEKQFAGKSNKMHAMRIMHELTHLKQGSQSVIEYAGEMKKLYRDLHFYHPFEAVDMKDMAIHHTWFQALVSKLFLDGLNQEFDLRRQLIFSHSEWPCLDDIIFSVLEEETRLAHPKLDNPNGVGARAALSIHNSHTSIFQKDQGRKKPDSEHCKFEGHTKEECFNLHGDPPGWRKGNLQHGGVSCVRQNLYQNSEGSQIDGSQYEENMKLLEADEQEYFTIYDEVHDSFDDMSLQENLLRGIYAYGFEKPSGIQQRGIVPFCRGLDVIQQSRSGTGKTAAFCMGVLQQVDYGLNQCQALVLAPTRELAQQIAKVIRALGEYLPVKIHVCVGGTNIRDDKRILSDGVHVVVGTPGRVFDMLRRQSLRAEHIRILVLDEADEMLPNDQIYDIFQLLPTKVQVGIFSSAMLPEVLKITRKFMNKPVRILAKHDDDVTIKGIKQFYKDIGKDEFKLIILQQIYKKLDITRSVIFVSTTKKVEWLTEKLRGDCTVLATHGDMNQNRADAIMREFRSGDQSQVLITTDQLAHDIPMQHVSLVISFDLPTQAKNYLHRIGRMGSKGLAIIFVISNDHDRNMFHDILKFYKMEMDKLPVDMGLLCL